MNDDLIEQFKTFQAAQRKVYYEQNKEKLLAGQKKYRKKNWDRVRATQYEWQKKNPEKWAEQIAKNQANKILRDIAYRKAHPELYRLNKGKYVKIRISKYANETPEQRKARQHEYGRKNWLKEKDDPVKILKHRNRALVYAHKKYHEAKKQRLRMKVIDAINQIRLKKLKEELYANIRATRGGDGPIKRIPPAQNQGEMGNRTSGWRETLRSLLRKRLG